ncbi:MAG: InlB B-repeat-containing protein [Kiritimatiellae bacterium]|nr:InlB B-repeat-containing protein [Kiritimatiellia bacterium]
MIFVAEGVYVPVNTANKKIRVIATGGLDKTIIDGGGTNRCVYVGDQWVNYIPTETNTLFKGFTIRNGYASDANGCGGGVSGGSYERCVLEGNRANDEKWGGAAFRAFLYNCLLVGNSAAYGGAADSSSLYNCTVVSNTASSQGGGIYNVHARNTIVWGNVCTAGNSYSNNYNGISATIAYSCIAPNAPGTGNINTNPYFADPVGGDYRLQQYSPCLDVGNNAYVVGDADLSGTNRVIDGRVDMGCYEGWVYLPTPSAIDEVSAEDGTRIGMVRLTWTAGGYARTYGIYRASTNILAASELIGTTPALFFDDDTAAPETNYWYWVKGVNPAGEGPFGASDSGWCMAPMTFGTDGLATAMVGLPYNAQLTISGGSGNYVWTSGADDYDIDGWESTYLMDIDSPSGLLFGDDVSTSYPLPFDFPFYGKSYNKLWISSNGTLTFDGEFRTYTPSLDVFKSRAMITPFWKDLLQGSGGVYVSENGGESVTFLWYNDMYYSGHGLVNASVTLFADGSIVCSYGDGNANGAFVGISAGDGTRFRYFDKQGTSLNNADDIVFLPQDVPGGLTLGEDGTLSGTPTAPGEYVFTVFVTDEYGNGATRQVSVTVEENPNMRTVTFDLGEYGVRSGGGDLHQYVLLGESATAPSVRSRAGWVFDGWNGSFTNIPDSVTVAAKYRSAYADLHVDAIDVTNSVAAGEALSVRWTVGNTGNPSFNGRMTERISLVSANNPDDVRVIASPVFEGTVARDGSVERDATIEVPLKGWDGVWYVRIETAVNPSVQEYAVNNVATNDTTLEITAVPLPNLMVGEISGDVNLVPGKTATFSFTTTNSGAATASAPWMERIYLEFVDSGIAVKVGDISRTNDLDSASAINGEYLLTIPEFISVAGAVRVKVVADANGDVVESDDDDNVAYGVGTLSLATNLYLTAASTSAYENISGSGVRFTVRRSGPTTEAMTVTLGNSDATSASIPATVTIPAGSVSTVFYVKPIDNATVEGPRTVTVSASAGDCRPASLALTILDNEVPKLTVTLDKTSIREGDGVILATVTRELVTDEPLTVYLAGASTSRCSYPSSVVVPAGEASVTFEISVPNNETAQIAQELTLRASSSGYTSAAVSYTVEDDDVPGVTLSLTPEVVSEGAGAQAIYATLMRSDTNQIAQAVRIRLTASEANQLILPNEITIPKYTMAVRFAIGVIDNALDDGDREIDIDGAIVIESCGCNGQSSNGDVIHATVDIIDNDGPALALKADPTTMKEGFDPAGYLVLSHNSTLTEDLTVRLWVDAENEDEIVIPETVKIHAGETSVRIPVATLDDGVEDGGQLVSIYAEVDGDIFAPASTWVQISDQNLPDLTVAKVETIASVVAMENFIASFAVTNTGFMATSKVIPYAVHLVKGANANAISSATLVKSGTLTGGIDVGDALYGTVTLTAPEMPGDYRVAVVVDPDGTISELDSANNTGWSSAIGVTVAYTATAGVDKKIYMPGEVVTITGVVSRADGTTAGNVQIDPYVMLSGMRRSLLTTTAADGSYSATFTPTSGEAGDYLVGACYPGVNSKVAQDSFSIIGMKRSSTANVIWDIALGDSATRTVTIQNRSAVPLTGLTVTFTDVPEECGFTYSLPDTIPANGSVVLTLTATATGVTEQEDYKKFYAHILSAEGVSLDFPLYFHSQAQQAYLRATPTSINTTMAIGQTRYIEVTLVNDGKGDSGTVSVSVPDVNWLKIVSGASIDNLASGESATVTLVLSPTAEDELTLNSPLSGGRMAVNCANGTGCSVSLKFTPVSEATGSITVDAVDNNTYTLESAPHLSNATVRVSNPYTGATVATGKTGADGIWTVDGIPEGTYQLTVTASNHDTYADAITVEPGRNVRKEAFLQYQLVTVSWNVEKTEVEDAYDIQLLLDFETHVPAPIVKTYMPGELPTLNSGESYAFIVLLENTGLIAAERVSLTMPDIPGYDFTLLDNGVAVPAKSSVSIAVVFSRGASRAVSATATKCVYAATTVVEYPCGREHPRYSYPTTVRHGQCVAETGGIWIPEYNFPDESVEGEPGRGGVTIWEPEDFIGGGSTTYRKVGCSPEDVDAVCASVTLKLSQTLAMTREAFDGTLTLYNGNTTAPITNLKLDVSVLDEDGNECRDLFEIFANGTSGSMSEGSVLAGGISVTAGGTGSAMIRFIPERGAAPAVEKLYRFGGTVTYTDPFSGETATVKLTPVSLTVSPSPYLHLDYFVQRDVFADDPFTANTVEASMPAELAVLVRNVGAGNANKVTIASAQPEMVQNEKGLLVDFDLKDYSLDKAALNGATANLPLSVVSLGTIVPNESKVAQWWLTSTIEGHFIGMSATVTPVNSWNTPDTMLVDPNVGVHKLVRSIVADGDTLPDFLVCDGSDLYGTPNEIYTAVGYQLPVYVASVAPSATLPAGGEIVLPLSLTPARSGWNYGYATIPGIFRYTISRIVRGDGTEISLRNAWITDRTFRDGNTPLLEDRLHIVDEFTSGSDQTYTVYLLAKPSDVPEVVAFEGVTDGSIEYSVRNAVTVVFSKPIDPATFTVDDLTLVKQGSYLNDISALTVTPADDSGTRFIIGNLSALCSGYGRYELTVQCAGIADTVGQLGTVGKSVAWTYATAEAPYVIGADGVPVRRVQSLDTISVTFSAPIKPETFTSAALRMNNVAVGSGVNIAALDASGTRFSVSGLSSAQTADGEYTLAVDATAVAGLDDTPGVNAYTATWTRDTVAPVLQSLAHEDGLNGNEFTLTFSEDVTSESLTPGGATIKRNGASVALPATASLRRVGDNAPYQYVLAGIDSVLSEDGAYELTFSSNGITDEAGNVASGSKSVSWTVDRTPPAQITDLAISPDGGFSDADGITYTGALTVSGTLPEAGLTVEIVAKYVGGGETVLTTLPTAGGDTLPAGAFSQNIVMPGTGNATLVVRLTDAAGNSSDSEKGVSVDGIALTGTLTGASDDEGVVMTTATLEFSAKPMDADVTFDKFALTRDGEAIALEGVMFTKVDDTTFTLTGLDSLCAEDGVYVLTFNGSAVRKYTSGLLMSGSLVMRWRYENPDREPPTVTEVMFDGEAPREAYTNVFSSVSVTFSEAVNVPDLIVNGLIDRAARIDLLDAAGVVTGCVATVAGQQPYQWDAESNTLSWAIDAAGVPAGRARLILDSGLIADLAGNRLAAGGPTAVSAADGTEPVSPGYGMRSYTLSEPVLTQVNAQAMPMWYNGELYVGEKTADSKGKIRHYAANGTWSYLQSEGVDIEIPAQGCQGASVAFADMDGDGVAETYVGTATGDVLKYPGGTAIISLGANRAMPYAYDIDGDGCDELVAGGMDGRIRVISRDATTGAYSMTVLTDVNGAALIVPNGRAAPIVADINHDGLADVVSGDTAGNVWAYLGERRDGGIAPYQGGDQGLTALPCCATPICVFTNDVGLADRSRLGYGDVNGDGIEDLIVGRSDGSVVAMLGAETPSPIVPFAVKAVVSASAGTHGAIAPVGDATYDGGDAPEYTITPDVGYHVADVQIDGVSIDATNNYVFAPLTTSHAIHADFAIDTFAVTFEAGAHGALSGETAQTIDYGGVAVVPTVTPDVGYRFTGWSGDVSVPIVGNVTFTAQYAAIPYAITYTGLKGASNTNPETYTVEDEVVFAAPGEVYGWEFKSWTPASIALGSTGAVEVAANWERQKFDVTVNGETKQYGYEEEVTFTAPEPFETNGMQVVSLGTTFTVPVVTNEFTVVVTNGIEFAWDVLATNWWFATAETENGSITAPEAGWMADGTNFTLVAIPVEHYHFVGWTGDTEGCTVTNGTGLSVAMDRPRTIGATFAIDAFTVVFEAGAHGALTGETSQTSDYGESAVVPAVAPDAGYEFIGWSGDVSAPVTSNATFTAQYAAISYAITYTGLKGASNTNPETYTVEDEVVFVAPGEVYGWEFKGWTPASIALGSTGAVEVAANWERMKFDVMVNGETKQYDYEEEVSLATNAAINCGATQYVCKGWTAVNAEPESGDGANAKFKVLGDVSFAWLWETNVVTLAQSVNAENLEWTAGGAAEWLPEWSEEAADGLHQAYCEAIPNGTNAWIATTVEGPGTIVFKWCSALAARNTKFQFMVDGEVKGMLSGTNGWTETSVTVLGAWKHEVRWRLMSGRSGAVAGDRVALDCVAWTPSAPPASSVSPTLAEALNTNLVWTTDGDVVWHGVAWQSPTDAREAWAEVSGLGDGGTAAVQTRVYGSGVLSFDWAVSCEEDYDWMELSVDGEVRGYVSGEADWTKYAVEIAGDGWHVVRWEFLKDEMDDPELAGANVARLDNVEWKSGDVPPALEETQTTPVPVPYAVLESEHFAHYLDLADGDYEAAAHSVGANGYAVWESYLAGLEPDNANSKFIAKIEMLSDGTPKVTWEPDTPELRATRTYIKYGKRRLDDREEVWTPIDDAVDGSVLRQYNFFKVEVKLKE